MWFLQESVLVVLSLWSIKYSIDHKMFFVTSSISCEVVMLKNGSHCFLNFFGGRIVTRGFN